MPHDATAATNPEQPVRYLPDRPLSKSGRIRRRKIAAAIGVPVDKVPDRRGDNLPRKRASDHYRWRGEATFVNNGGYRLIRVGVGHPLAFSTGYALEHHVVWAAAGNPPPKPGEAIHHVNEDKTDNRIENLQLMTRADHNAHHNAIRGRDEYGRLLPKSGREKPLPPPIGEHSPTAKLDVPTVARIKLRLSQGTTQVVVAKEFGISSSQVGNIATGKCWGHVEAASDLADEVERQTNLRRVGRERSGRTLDGVVHEGEGSR